MNRWRHATLILVAIALAAGVTGCSSEQEPAGPAETGESGDVTEPVGEWEQTLPIEPGYAWDIALYPGGGQIPVDLQVAGPWALDAGDDWAVITSEIVSPDEVPGIEAFEDAEFVEKTAGADGDYYFPRQVTDEWMLQLGKITVAGEQATPEPYTEPLKLWPVDFEVGDTFVLADGGSFKIEATVLAQNSATVPAGTIDDAYLLRFDYTPLAEGALSGSQYYMLSPTVGFVALFGVAAGDEATGFTALDSAQVLVSLPEKR